MSSGSRVAPCWQTEWQTDERTDMTKLIMTFRNFVNAPKNCKMLGGYSIVWKGRSTAIMTVEKLRTSSSGLSESTLLSETCKRSRETWLIATYRFQASRITPCVLLQALLINQLACWMWMIVLIPWLMPWKKFVDVEKRDQYIS